MVTAEPQLLASQSGNARWRSRLHPSEAKSHPLWLLHAALVPQTYTVTSFGVLVRSDRCLLFEVSLSLEGARLSLPFLAATW